MVPTRPGWIGLVLVEFTGAGGMQWQYKLLLNIGLPKQFFKGLC